MQRVYDERLALSPGAEALVRAEKKNGVALLLVSGGFTFFTARLQARLVFDHAFSNQDRHPCPDRHDSATNRRFRQMGTAAPDARTAPSASAGGAAQPPLATTRAHVDAG